jgi:hypothetical protein
VPRLATKLVPFTFKSLMITTVSPALITITV